LLVADNFVAAYAHSGWHRYGIHNNNNNNNNTS
jgi:hypothetical protein